MMEVQNKIAQTNLQVISSREASNKILQGYKVLSPNIHVTTEKWDGGHTYITITFYDFDTNLTIVVVKSSGIGLTISHDQNIAVNSIEKKLYSTFGKRSQ